MFSLHKDNAWQVDRLSSRVSHTISIPHAMFSSPLQILTLTPAVAGETPANISERQGFEMMTAWMYEHNIF